MKNNRPQRHNPSINAPILSLKRDRRIGDTPEGWSLYETPTKWIYCGIPHPEGDEYIVPIASSLIRDFRILAMRGDPSSIITQLETLSGLRSSDTTTEANSAPENIPPVPPEEYAEDILYLVPGTDQVWGTGKDVTALVSANGIPYFLHEDFCICCSSAAFCSAYALLNNNEPADIQTGFSDDGSPCFTATQGETTITFHICDEALKIDHTQNVNVIHVTPVAIEGRHNGRVIHMRR